MLKKYNLLLLMPLILTGCKNSDTSSSLLETSSLTSEKESSLITNSSLSETSSSFIEEELTKDFVVSKLNSLSNKSYSLNYLYSGTLYNDVYVPNSYYYNDMAENAENEAAREYFKKTKDQRLAWLKDVEDFISRKIQYDDMTEEEIEALPQMERLIAKVPSSLLDIAMRWMHEDYGEN